MRGIKGNGRGGKWGRVAGWVLIGIGVGDLALSLFLAFGYQTLDFINPIRFMIDVGFIVWGCWILWRKKELPIPSKKENGD